MITLCTLPSFKGTNTEKMKALVICLGIDALYFLPLVYTYLTLKN